MSEGYVFFGTDDINKTTNIECAYVLSTNLKMQDPDCETCVIVHKFDHVPKKYESGFDYIIELPFGRTEVNHHNIFIDFWQLYHCTPFEENIFINTFSFPIDNIASLWEAARIGPIVFPSVLDYRGDLYTQNDESVYKQNDVEFYSGDLLYFRKDPLVEEFFKMADVIFKGWRDIYLEFLPEKRPVDFDLNVVVSLLVQLICEQYTTLKYFDYTDLTLVDDIEDNINLWITDDLRVKANNYRQTGIFKYGNPEVVNMSDIVEKSNGRFIKKKAKIKA